MICITKKLRQLKEGEANTAENTPFTIGEIVRFDEAYANYKNIAFEITNVHYQRLEGEAYANYMLKHTSTDKDWKQLRVIM